jgi:hypothetical protein
MRQFFLFDIQSDQCLLHIYLLIHRKKEYVGSLQTKPRNVHFLRTLQTKVQSESRESRERDSSIHTVTHTIQSIPSFLDRRME